MGFRSMFQCECIGKCTKPEELHSLYLLPSAALESWLYLKVITQQVRNLRYIDPRMKRTACISLRLVDRGNEMEVYKGHAQAPNCFHWSSYLAASASILSKRTTNAFRVCHPWNSQTHSNRVIHLRVWGWGMYDILFWYLESLTLECFI